MESLVNPLEEVTLLRLIRNTARGNEQLLDQLRFFRKIIGKLNIAIFIHDLSNLRHIWTNNNYSKIIGYTDAEMKKMGPEWAKRNYHPEDVHILSDRIDYFRNNKGDTFSGVYRIKHKKGHWVWVYSNTVVLSRNENGMAEQILGICIDFSDNFKTMKQFKTLYQENQQLKNQLNISKLTKREKEIIKLIARGKTSHEIAQTFHISKCTVDNHRKSMLRKLKLHNIAELTRFAIEAGLA